MTDVAQNPGTLTLAEAARIMREAVRDKSYQDLPLGGDAAAARAIEQIGIAAQASAVTAAQALVRMNRAFEASANRSRHDPRKTP